jgi:hypothetical protein
MTPDRAATGAAAWLSAAAWALVACASPRGVLAQEAIQGGGSRVPCAVPLRWRVARVDAGFGISDEEAARAMREAASLWERAAGRNLFEEDPDEGFPVRLVYGERQARAAERAALVARADALASRIEAQRTELAAREGTRRAREGRLAERARGLEARISRHNQVVREWNERGGPPASVEGELARQALALAAERRAIEIAADSLAREAAALADEAARLASEIGEHASLVAALDAAPLASALEAGEYREAVRERGGRREASREIRVYAFTDRSEFVLVLAHELGHALGLGHSGTPGAVMSAEHVASERSRVLARLPEADLRALLAVCPGLGRS